VNGVKGAAEIVKAQYSAAVSSESAAIDNADNLFNKGLAQVLNKDYQNALTSFKEATAKTATWLLPTMVLLLLLQDYLMQMVLLAT
jgi:outer membrane protein assembly factor BamD (BamD/ComL family)